MTELWYLHLVHPMEHFIVRFYLGQTKKLSDFVTVPLWQMLVESLHWLQRLSVRQRCWNFQNSPATSLVSGIIILFQSHSKPHDPRRGLERHKIRPFCSWQPTKQHIQFMHVWPSMMNKHQSFTLCTFLKKKIYFGPATPRWTLANGTSHILLHTLQGGKEEVTGWASAGARSGFTFVIYVSADLAQDLAVAWQPRGGSGGKRWGVCARAWE